MGSFWDDNVQSAGKLPLFLCLVAFVVTFIVTRVIVRMIRSGKGPFKDNNVGGVHVHHVVPGLFLMIIGGLVGVASIGAGWDIFGGIVFGMGLALVLDEFALVLHLDDVYWEEQGRLSVDVVFVIAAVMGLMLVVGAPFGVERGSAYSSIRILSLVHIIVNLSMSAVAASKGKLVMGSLGVVVPLVGWIGAIRIARPTSPWAKRRYPADGTKMAKAIERETNFDTRWRSKVTWLQESIAGFGPVK